MWDGEGYFSVSESEAEEEGEDGGGIEKALPGCVVGDID